MDDVDILQEVVFDAWDVAVAGQAEEDRSDEAKIERDTKLIFLARQTLALEQIAKCVVENGAFQIVKG